MGFVALKRLRWGEETIMPGEPVPEGEEGRSYASLLAHGLIAETNDIGSMSDEELAEHAKGLEEKLANATARIGELEQSAPAEEIEVPDEITPGITAGWPIDATTGGPLALTDKQRTELVDKGILPEGTDEQPVSAIVTRDGELVVICAPESASETESTGAQAAAPETEEAKPKAKAADKGTPAKSKAKAADKGK